MLTGKESTRKTPYQLYNYTWLIINEASEVANASSTIGSSASWRPLEVDLCKLALGAHSDWGVPDKYLPLERAPKISNHSTDPD